MFHYRSNSNSIAKNSKIIEFSCNILTFLVLLLQNYVIIIKTDILMI